MVGSPIPRGVMGRWVGSWHSIRLPWYWQYQASCMRNLGGSKSEQCTVVLRGLMTQLMGSTNTLVPLKIAKIWCEQFPGFRECGSTETG